MTKDGMKEKLSAVFVYLTEYIDEHGFPPSVREICSELDIRSTATAYCYLEKLEQQGLIRKSRAKNRAIEICAKESVTQKSLRVPLIGQVTCGQPIFAYENMEGYYALPEDFFGKSNELFMLRAKGDSMIEIGIFDGDLLVVRKQPYANEGDIVVALVEDEATVKRFQKRKDYFVLHPENIYFKDIVLKKVDILGIVQGLVRTNIH